MRRVWQRSRSCEGQRLSSRGFGLIEVMAALCVLLAASMISVSAGKAGWRAVRTARLEAGGLAAGRDKMEELIARPSSARESGQDEWHQGADRFVRIWRVRPWSGFPGLQRLEVSTRWSDQGLVLLDLVAVAP